MSGSLPQFTLISTLPQWEPFQPIVSTLVSSYIPPLPQFKPNPIPHKLHPSTMATLHPLFTLSLFFLTASAAHPPSQTTVLDVAASIHLAHHAIHPHQEEPQEITTKIPSSLSLQIHPRISLLKPGHHKDYRSLTHSRLARDAHRVKSLLSTLDLSLTGISRADLKPNAESTRYGAYSQEDLAAPLTSGASQGSGEYFSRIGVGTPPRPYYTVIDTGSDVTWIQCEPCSDCYQQSDPIYRPASSSTYSPVTCGSPLCASLETSACRGNTCLYQVSYGDGSFTVGNFVTETVSFGNTGTVKGVALGCGHDNEGLFVGSAGLLGLGGGRLSLPSQIKATSFSYCLVDRDSRKTSTLEFNTAAPRGSVTTRLLTGGVKTFYYVALTGMSVGGQPLSIPQSVFSAGQSGIGGVIVDSGTAVTRLPTQAYNSLRDAFVRLTQHLPSAGQVSLFDTCYDLSSMSSVRVPTVAFNFAGGGVLELPAKNYVIPVDSSGVFCFAFAPTTSSLSIIGNVQQQGTRVHFDMARSTVSFSPNNC